MDIFNKIVSRNIGTDYADGVVLYKSGEKPEHIFSVISGEVNLYTKEGKKVLTIGKGNFVGLDYLFNTDYRGFTAITNGPTKLIKLEKKLLTQRIHQDPSLAFKILSDVSYRYRTIIANIS
ncbi:MAG: Crp/Fnr family transcriptional regulator [Magnetococcales bacterium]|nr:Crp/Fnr family transcriptional regulator [Magnetococcales bacterium]